MSVINLLSSDVYNRIAAGEVVERPASVVKELIENSIDADATQICISIAAGGKSSIKVTDNGRGIEKSELKKALLPHATSKIFKAEDLDNIRTLGFRGEALASIASVSKVTIVSKPFEQEYGAMIESDGGKMSEPEDCPAVNGTEITVNNLFFNTPAREKFLKSDRSEENEISSTIAKLVLGNPDIAIKFVADGRVMAQSFGDGFKSAFVSVYGAAAIKECYYIDTEKNGVEIKGYVCKPEFAKGTRAGQTVFLNGRFINNQTISSAVSNAYSSYLMKRRYPYYMLDVHMPAEEVDCNVHPNKTDVRFLNNQIVYGAIYSIVSKVLDGAQEAPEIIKEEKKGLDALDDLLTAPEDSMNALYENKGFYAKSPRSDADKYKFDKPIKFAKIILNDSSPASEEIAVSDEAYGEEKITSPAADREKTLKSIYEENKAYLLSLEKKEKETKSIQSELAVERPLNYVGQVLSTYLVFDDGESVYMVDQHAAHERMLYDKFSANVVNGTVVSQPLIIPFILTTSGEEYDFIVKDEELLKSMGFDVCEFGRNAFKISAVPVILSDINLKEFFDDLLSDSSQLKSVDLKVTLKDRIAQKACKAAVKAGNKMTDADVQSLKEVIEKNKNLKCPHGRPAVIKITQTEIEKWFKRIV